MNTPCTILSTMLVACICMAACKRSTPQQCVWTLQRQGDTLCHLQLWHGDTLLDTWVIPHPVLSLSQGDITGDGQPEAALCVVAPTRHFRQDGRRPWLFKVVKGRFVRPLWLGSQLSHPLHSLTIRDSSVWAIEHDTDSSYLVARYSARGFGLRHEEYVARHTTLHEAQKTIKLD